MLEDISGNLSTSSMKILGLNRLTRLTNLDLTNGVISNESIIAHLPRSLYKLCLYSLPQLSSDALVRLPNQLTSLELNGNFHLDYAYQNFPTTLQVLRLKGCVLHGPKIVFPPKLRELQLEALSGNLSLCLRSLTPKYQVFSIF